MGISILNDQFVTKGAYMGVKETRPFHGIMFDGSEKLYCGCSVNVACSFVVEGMKVNKSTGVITRGRLGAVQPAGTGATNLSVLIDSDPSCYYVVSVFICNQHTAVQYAYLGLAS